MSLKQSIQSSERLVSVMIKGLGQDPEPVLLALSKATKKDRLAALESLYVTLTTKVGNGDS